MERISPITGQPVRKYTKKAAIVIPVAAPRKEMKIEIYRDIICRKVTSENYTTGYIIPSATMNCQLSVGGCMGSFIAKSKNIIADLKDIRSKIGGNILLCDIKESYMATFHKKIPAKNIIMLSPYTSTNGSKMNICLIKMTNL